MSLTGEKLKDFWLTRGIGVRSGATKEQLDLFESKYQVRLSKDLRDYFETVNGMEAGQCDEDLIYFWPIDDIRNIAEEFGECEHQDARNYFIFADWSICALEYAVWVSSEGEEVSPVFVITRELIKVANSFTEFIGEYINGNNDVLFLSHHSGSVSSASALKLSNSWRRR
jgi:hypothetical protein